ncbi:MAG: hypothetical protein JO317_08210 [Verrucomicrobiae bacterium]|nr:hypothetical protein [Verrucomicrobiae bacterium]
MPSAVPASHVDLDGAWPEDAIPGADRLDFRSWGPRLRFITTDEEIEAFDLELGDALAPFVLFGSGDFHHLSAIWLRRLNKPFILISFDNHPDWDRRPPRWGCGGWINRALEDLELREAAVWGCGNFELNLPHRLFGNRSATASGRLKLFAWAESLKPGAPAVPLTRENWRDEFLSFLGPRSGVATYVTVDLDCLRASEAVTNWENGLFESDDVAWAIGEVRARTQLIGGDVCGAYSEPRYARFGQRLAAGFDRPKMKPPGEAAREVNLRSLRKIWSALTGGDQQHAADDQQHADRQA